MLSVRGLLIEVMGMMLNSRAEQMRIVSMTTMKIYGELGHRFLPKTTNISDEPVDDRRDEHSRGDERRGYGAQPGPWDENDKRDRKSGPVDVTKSVCSSPGADVYMRVA